MIYIAHRGNTNGPNSKLETSPGYIEKAINDGFDVEVDIWYIEKELWLGHDEPQYNVDEQWVRNNIKRCWFHAKDYAALLYLSAWVSSQGRHGGVLRSDDLCVFYHHLDNYTLTTTGFIWAYPGQPGNANTIAVLPELHHTNIRFYHGICSDYVKEFRDDKAYYI